MAKRSRFSTSDEEEQQDDLQKRSRNDVESDVNINDQLSLSTKRRNKERKKFGDDKAYMQEAAELFADGKAEVIKRMEQIHRVVGTLHICHNAK